MISGYCISAAAHNAEKGNRTRWHFVRRRFLRIYPAYWCSIVVILCIFALPVILRAIVDGSISFHHKAWMGFSPGTWLSIVTLAEIFFARDSHSFPFGAFGSLNAVYWTLAIEVQFYLVSACLVSLRQRTQLVLIIGMSILGLISFRSKTILESGLFLPFWPMFATGWLIFKWRTTFIGTRALVSKVNILLAICACAFLILLGDGGKSEFAYYSFATIAAAAVLCLGTIFESSKFQLDSMLHNMRAVRWLGLVGVGSFSLYLTHVPFWNVSDAVVMSLVQLNQDAALKTVLKTISTGILVLAFFLLVERRILLRLRA